MDLRKVRIRYQNALLLLLIFINFLTIDLYPQDLTRPSRQAAYDSFSKGDYEKAFREFTILLQNYPKDPLYKYYCGACLVKLNREPSTASGYLQDAVSSQLEIRTIPDDAWYYLGRAQQMSGNFSQAVKSYNSFEKNAGRKAAKDLNVAELISQCREGKGELKEPVYKEIIDSNITGAAGKKVIADQPADSGTLLKPAAVPKAEARKETLPASYDRRLTEAMDYQVRADSLTSLAEKYREEYGRLPAGQKQAAMARISETEALAGKYQKMADERFGRSDTLNAGKKQETKISREIKPVAEALPDTGVKETGRVAENPDRNNMHQNTPDSTKDIFSIFSVTDPALLAGQKIDIDPRLPAGLIYRIQIGVYTKPLTQDYFKGIVPVSGFKIPGTVSVRYFAGMFRQSVDAGKAMLRVRQTGFRDAFVVAAMDGKPVSLERAAMLEKEWGQKPFLTVSVASAENKGGSVAPTLVFRVEILRSSIPVSDEKSETLKTLAGSRGLEILLSGDGTYVYLIGKFITFESADEYASLIKRNGYLNARVVAYLGNREIEVEKAKKLFEEAQ